LGWQVPQNWSGDPQESLLLLGAQAPSGAQHEVRQVQVVGPPSSGAPASSTASASQRAIAHRS
jgi:hypothetical protein